MAKKIVEVQFGRVDIHDDMDNWGSGELYFRGFLRSDDNQSTDTGWSAQQDLNSGEHWSDGRKISLLVEETTRIRVSYEGYDEDVTVNESLGTIGDRYAGPSFGAGDHSSESSLKKFTVQYTIGVSDA